MRVLPGGAGEEKARQTFYAKSLCISKIFGILKCLTLELSNEKDDDSDQKGKNCGEKQQKNAFCQIVFPKNYIFLCLILLHEQKDEYPLEYTRKYRTHWYILGAL